MQSPKSHQQIPVRRVPPFRRLVLATAVASTLAAGVVPRDAIAATKTWVGNAASSNWSIGRQTLPGIYSGTNWGAAGNAMPTNGDSLIFSGTNKLSNNNDLLTSISNLTFDALAGPFTLNGNGLVVTGALSNLSNQVQTINLPITVGTTGKTWDGGSQGILLNGAFNLGNNSLKLMNKFAINTSASNFIVGDSGIAALSLQSGSSVSGDWGNIGNTATGNGGVTVDGAGSAWNFNTLRVGLSGTGTLNVRNGGMVTSAYTELGGNSDGRGSMTVDGAGSAWTNSGDLYVGHIGTGNVKIQNGGVFTGGVVFLGFFNHPGSSGTVTVDGRGSAWNSGSLTVGNVGAGTLNIQNGGLVSTPNLVLGSQGILNLRGGVLSTASISSATGAQFNWTAGTLNYTTDASLGNGWVGLDSVLALTTGKTLQIDNTLTIGNGNVLVLAGGSVKSGAMSLNGGTIVANSGLNISDTGNLTGHGTVSGAITGGTGKTITASGGTLTLGNGGVSGGFNFAGSLVAGGNQVILLSADKAQLGTSTTLGAGGNLSSVNGANLVAGNTLSFTGDTSIHGDFTNNGQVSGSSGALTFLNDVNGAGSFAGNIVFHASYNPGNSPATVNFNGGNATFGSAAVLNMEIFGSTPGVEYDQLLNINTLSFNGTLNLIFGNGFVPLPGSSYTLFGFEHFNGSLAQERITVSGYDRSKLDLSHLGVDGSIGVSISAVPEPDSWAMLLAGLGMVGVIAQRRKRVALAA